MKFFFFDVGGTLIEPTPSVAHIYRGVLEQFGWQGDPKTLGPTFRRVFDAHVARSGDAPLSFGRNEQEGQQWWRRLVFDVFDAIRFGERREACFRALFEAFEDPSVWRVFDDVFPTLEGFERAKVPVGIISNWDYRLPPLLKKLGLWERFDPVLISCFEGVAKPSADIFRRALARVGLAAEDVGYVGDKPDLDLWPARRVGMRAHWIDRTGAGGDAEVEGVVQSLRQLVPAAGA